MALYLNDQKLLPKLAMGDLVSNKLFYHKGCYKYYLNRYRSAVNTAKITTLNHKQLNDYIKAMCFNKIMTYVYEKGQEQENVSFDVSELE